MACEQHCSPSHGDWRSPILIDKWWAENSWSTKAILNLMIKFILRINNLLWPIIYCTVLYESWKKSEWMSKWGLVMISLSSWNLYKVYSILSKNRCFYYLTFKAWAFGWIKEKIGCWVVALEGALFRRFWPRWTQCNWECFCGRLHCFDFDQMNSKKSRPC